LDFKVGTVLPIAPAAFERASSQTNAEPNC